MPDVSHVAALHDGLSHIQAQDMGSTEALQIWRRKVPGYSQPQGPGDPLANYIQEMGCFEAQKEQEQELGQGQELEQVLEMQAW